MFKENIFLIHRDMINMPENKAYVSKSCDDLTRDNQEDHMLPIMNEKSKQKSISKKFAFQSTIRQIERKKIAEKLSKEAEYKGLKFKFTKIKCL